MSESEDSDLTQLSNEFKMKNSLKRSPSPTTSPEQPKKKNKVSDEEAKVLTAATFRYVLENLSKDQKGKSRSEKWKSFWDSVKPDFESPVAPETSDPFYHLWTEYSTQDGETQLQLLDAGRELYGTLSGPLHNPDLNDYSTTIPERWKDHVPEILKALTPVDKISLIDGKPDFTKELKRYTIREKGGAGQDPEGKKDVAGKVITVNVAGLPNLVEHVGKIVGKLGELTAAFEVCHLISGKDSVPKDGQVESGKGSPASTSPTPSELAIKISNERLA